MLSCVFRPLLFIMSALWDYENWLLSRYNIELGMPVGLERLTHEPWTTCPTATSTGSSTWRTSKPAMATIGSLSARKTLQQLRQRCEQKAHALFHAAL